MDIDEKDGILCEFIPFDGAFLPLSFWIGGDFAPPDGVTMTVFRNAVSLSAERFIRADNAMRLVAQEIYGDCTASVFLQGRVQASVEDKAGGNIQTCFLEDDFLSCRILREGDCLILLAPRRLAVLSRTGELLLDETVLSAEAKEGRLKAAVPFADSLCHVAKCEWRCGEGLELLSYTITARQKPNRDLFLYALLEGLLIGADVKDFVTEELYGKLSDLKRFLGGYASVVFVTEEVAGLSYPLQSNVFRVDYYEAAYRDGKIDNLKEKEIEP